MPTWDAPGAYVVKNTKSPDCSCPRLTEDPTLNCSAAVLGREIPEPLNTYCEYPEQSKPLRLVHPKMYGTPCRLSAWFTSSELSDRETCIRDAAANWTGIVLLLMDFVVCVAFMGWAATATGWHWIETSFCDTEAVSVLVFTRLAVHYNCLHTILV